MEITFNLFIHESNSITHSEKNCFTIKYYIKISQNIEKQPLTVRQEMPLIYTC